MFVSISRAISTTCFLLLSVGRISTNRRKKRSPDASRKNSRTIVVASPTRATLVGLATTMVLLFFLLASGDLFLRRFVEILPTLSNKKQVVEIAREIETNISGYLATISLMNLIVGVATAVATYL